MTNGQDVRLVAVEAGDGQIYRLAYTSPSNHTASLSEDFRKSTYSMRKLTAKEKNSIKPYRIKVITVQAGDTVKSIANKIPHLGNKVERLALLNGINIDEPLKSGQKLKTITTY